MSIKQSLTTAALNLSRAVGVSQSDDATVTEGCVPFGEFQTYFRAVGELSSPKPVLILLHGGPGSTHNYLEVLDRLAGETGRVVLSYDQLGCGNSYVGHRPELWRAQTWVDELQNLIDALDIRQAHLLGQSWGGMLAITYLVDRAPAGIRSVILSSTLSESRLWGEEQLRLARQLPAAQWAAIARAVRTGNYAAADYRDALRHYMQLHCNDQVYGEDAPECLRRPKRFGAEAYATAWGPSEFAATGTLAGWNYTDRLREIAVPALVISGSEDMCTPTIARTLADHLPDARWEQLPDCRHMCFVDDNDAYCALLADWMARRD